MLAFLLAPFRRIWTYRAILARTTLIEMRRSYAGAILGLVWLVLGPLLLLGLYALVYTVVFRIQPEGSTPAEFVLRIFCGLVPFLAFSSALVSGSSSLSANRQLLLNTVFPAELIPVRSVLTNSMLLVTGFAIVLIADSVLNRTSALLLLVPLVVASQVLFVMGLAWVTSLLSLIVRDLQQALGYLVLALLIGSPIAYTPEMIPERLRLLVYLNPLSYFILAHQTLILEDRLPPAGILVGVACVSLATCLLGFWIFQRVKQVFLDYA